MMHHISIALSNADGRAVGQIIFHVVELRVLFLVDDFFVREGGQGLGVPVDHAHAAVDEAFAIEVYEHLDDALGARAVHGEGGAVPIAGAAEFAQLLQDDASVLLGPRPCVLEELLAGEVGLLDALLGQAVDDLSLRGDAGMVGARYPAGILALHTSVANEDVLYGLVQHVAHVEHARHVGRRNDHGIRLAAVGLRAEQLIV